MGNLEEGLRWLAQAGADLKTATGCLNNEDYYASAFFCQQTAEKALKGLLYAKGYRAIVTHSIVKLLKKLASKEAEFEGLLKEGRELDRHYIGSRYPNFYPDNAPYEYYTEEEAKGCIKYATLILNTVKKYLKK